MRTAQLSFSLFLFFFLSLSIFLSLSLSLSLFSLPVELLSQSRECPKRSVGSKAAGPRFAARRGGRAGTGGGAVLRAYWQYTNPYGSIQPIISFFLLDGRKK
uniref:Putative secreted protein n=1 Tax=Anopheles darlingi TaxID=43151 RepID=A0A2M4DBG5_ANODA